MTTFTIDGKELELKITFDAVKRLNKAFDGGTYELIGKAIAGDVEAFPIIIHAALLHTGEKITQKQVEKEIESKFESGELSFEDIQTVTNEVVSESFFYKPTVQKIMKKNPEMKKAYEQLIS